MRLSRKAIPAVLVALALGFWTSVEPALHAGRVEAHNLSLPEQIFAEGASAEARIKQRPFEERSPDDYPRAIDLYRQVTELAGSPDLRDRARMRMADLTREMALRTGDASLFERAIDIYRQLVIDRPDSPFLGEALVSIAETYEFELQDIDGATAAYRDLARRFPQSVSGREAEANLARLDPALSSGSAGTDIIGTVVAPGAELALSTESDGPDGARVVNIRSFAGPDYARIVVDLSRPVTYREQRDGARVSYRLPGVELSGSLLGRRLATVRGSLLKQMRVEQLGDGVAITLDASSLESAAAFLLEDPNRLIIDLRGVTPRIAG
ncbi:MAG: tetratricopeptide repeat protein, partial [Blastocatellia bacterium]